MLFFSYFEFVKLKGSTNIRLVNPNKPNPAKLFEHFYFAFIWYKRELVELYNNYQNKVGTCLKKYGILEH